MPGQGSMYITDDDVVLDSLPESVEETIRQRDAWIAQRRRRGEGLEFVVADVQRWTPGQTVRVAFLGGSAELHAEIEEATLAIMEACNIRLDSRDASTGKFRTWSEQDEAYQAEIRVRFDLGGYFSLVGTDSINAAIGGETDAVGGRPWQCSLNLGGFTGQLPANWRGTTRHEFLHALSFHHSHQNMRGPCEQEFRWEDDPGYQLTKDPRGVFVTDGAERRPGIYTYLSGPPNNWPRAKVDHNLKTQVDDPDVVAGPFDPASVMLYRFPALFYKRVPSACAPTTEGIELSAGDQRGLRLLYPRTSAEMEAVVGRRRKIVSELEVRRSVGRDDARDGLESARRDPEVYERQTAAALGSTLADVR